MTDYTVISSGRKKPMFEQQFGHSIFPNRSNTTATYQKEPLDSRRERFAGIPENSYFPLEIKEPNRNQRDPRGNPYKRPPLQGYDYKDTTPYSVTERYIKKTTYVDGLRKSTNVSKIDIDKQKKLHELKESLERFDQKIAKLEKDRDELPEDNLEFRNAINQAIAVLKAKRKEFELTIDPQAPLKQGLDVIANLLRNMQGN